MQQRVVKMVTVWKNKKWFQLAESKENDQVFLKENPCKIHSHRMSRKTPAKFVTTGRPLPLLAAIVTNSMKTPAKEEPCRGLQHEGSQGRTLPNLQLQEYPWQTRSL